MKNKINLGYGFVEFNEGKGFNISTKNKETISDGLMIEMETNKEKQMENLMFAHRFLDTILFEQIYSQPLQTGLRGDFKDVIFLINHEYMLHVLVDQDNKVYPVLLKTVGDDVEPVKFSYEGETLKQFFNEIVKDVNDLFNEE
ncbi:hypothetical protein VPIG_00178 [Vibrio phage PWH3a-P1]|uniref:hypothetical protein n=1 Tax=Vibrio phage PWH3a-P1 TaxID=754058 RepID=UPI0002C0EEAC|nr:hypothetical protein VPIG_00178 [Vibrio phage PWH3a-P1]AGH32034.1 hypothetical protein VPIG_00178 [Vibrio phage PWH3a-P1]